MNPFRRKHKDGELSSPDTGDPAASNASSTNYLSFQDTAIDGNNHGTPTGPVDADDNDLVGPEAETRHSPGRWTAGRRADGMRTRNTNNSNDDDDDDRNNNSSITQPTTHRGFSTSIHDMFQTPENERVDCCALTCCGMLQSDRDRYFLQGVTPPSLTRRLWLHIIFPVCLFAIAGFAAFHIPDARINQAFTTSALLLFVIYLILQCLKGRAKRIEIRKDLLWTKAQLLDQRRLNLSVILEQERPEDHGQDQEYYLGQTRGDFLAAHPCFCACYAEDRLMAQMRQPVNDEDDAAARHGICTRLWEWFCPPCCGMHWQCCGVCALAQEGREVERALLPRSYLRVDYITMQPYSDYFPAIYEARHEHGSHDNQAEPSGDTPHNVRASSSSSSSSNVHLSRLSWQLLQVLATLVVLLVFWVLAGPIFWKKVAQANIPAWRLFQWADLLVFSITWVHAIGLLSLFVYLANRPKAAEVSMDALVKFFAAGFCLSTSLAVFWEIFLGLIVKVFVSLSLALAGVDISERPGTQMSTYVRDMGQAVTDNGNDGFLETFGKDHPVFYTIYLAVASFLLAAFVEEICKYFGYRMVEHPDFLSRREIEDAMHVVHGEFEDPDEVHPERQDFSKQRSSAQSHGAAVTIAMVAVAMGFTCCENLVYVFIYSGSSLKLELSVLVARSFFPVHPLAAALQSVGVVERDIERHRRAYLGRIIAPAVIFHGGYDFLLLWIDFLSQKNGNFSEDDDSLQWPVLLSFSASLIVLLVTLKYYMDTARTQRNRLADMDRGDAAVRSSLI